MVIQNYMGMMHRGVYQKIKKKKCARYISISFHYLAQLKIRNTVKIITFRGSGLPSATGTSGHPAISHYSFAH